MQMLDEVLLRLEKAMKSEVTADILREAIKSQDKGTYFDDFLGDGDLSAAGERLTVINFFNPILESWEKG